MDPDLLLTRDEYPPFTLSPLRTADPLGILLLRYP